MTFKNTWHAFTAAPHRVMFFGGALQSIGVMVWWLLELATRYGVVGQPALWAVTPVAAHAWLMVYGLFPFFMFGFLMTVFPRWMRGDELPPQRYVPAFLLLLLGSTGFYLGLAYGRTLLVMACASTLAGWALAIHALLRVLLDTPPQDKRHPLMILVALVLGWCSLAAYPLWLWQGNNVWLRLTIQGGVWLFLLPIFASVAHRMFPFFTSSALPQHAIRRPEWPWWLMLAASATHAMLQLAGASAWLWLADFPLAAAAGYLGHAWGFGRSLRIPLLGILHIGFAWIGIAGALSGLQSLLVWSAPDAPAIWGLAPLHALTIGCFATLAIGMGTRVTLGHSGLPMQVDGAVKLMFLGMQAVTLLRVVADMWPSHASYWLYLAAALLWLGCFTPWVWRYLPAYWRPRADGRPG